MKLSISMALVAASSLCPVSSYCEDGTGAQATARIAWYGTWEGGLSEAKRSGRPILLVSAAPHCHDVAGIW